MKNERPDGWVSFSLRHRLGLMRGLRQNFTRPWLPRQIQFHSSGRRAGDWRPRDRPCGDCVPGRQARAAGRIEGAFCRGIVSFGNGPRRVFPDIVDYAKGGIFSRLRAVVRSTLGISPSAWEATQTDMGEVPAAVVACILQRGAEINSAGGYLRSDAKIRVRRFFAWPDPDGARLILGGGTRSGRETRRRRSQTLPFSCDRRCPR
ncbi:hypothetical protein ABIA00_000215 [Bradyrhizobium ottawaense]|uniref:replication initiation protein RepC n=1 Tax=Bradyrhizobium ottawaense TaxID=931866 RepID=UPI003838823C